MPNQGGKTMSQGSFSQRQNRMMIGGVLGIIFVGVMVYTWKRGVDTTCEVPEGSAMVLYGGEGNKANILPSGTHPFAGFEYEHDYMVKLGRNKTKLDVRVAQGSVANLGHLIARNKWVEGTVIDEAAEALTPSPTYVTVELEYDVSADALQKLVDDSNDAPYETTIFPKLVMQAYSGKAAFEKKEGDGKIKRAWNLVKHIVSEVKDDEPDVEKKMATYLEKELGKRYDISLASFKLIDVTQKKLGDDEPIKPAYLSCHPAPPGAKVKVAPTFMGMFMANLGMLIAFIVFLIVVVVWVAAGAPGADAIDLIGGF